MAKLWVVDGAITHQKLHSFAWSKTDKCQMCREQGTEVHVPSDDTSKKKGKENKCTNTGYQKNRREERRPRENEHKIAMDGSLTGVVGKCVLRVLGE